MKGKSSPGANRQPRKARRHAAKQRRIGIVLLVLLTLAVSAIALSRNSSQANSSPQSKKRYVATREIIFDQMTGKRRKPTVEETETMVNQLSALTNRSTEGLKTTQLPNGMEMVDLDGRFGGVVLGRANEDGTTEVRCVMTMEEAEEFLGLEAVPVDQ